MIFSSVKNMILPRDLKEFTMKKLSIVFAVLCCPTLFGATDSSVKIPYSKHQKYTLSNQKNHPTIRLEGERYLASLAKLTKDDVLEALQKEGFKASSVSLRDETANLVYVAYVKNDSNKSLGIS